MIDLGSRVLMNNGVSVVSDTKAIKYLIAEGELPDYIRVIESKDSKAFKQMYQTNITYDGEETEIAPDKSYNDDDYQVLKERIIQTFRDDTDKTIHLKRLDSEFSYFERENQVHLLLKIDKLIERFKQENIVWGVGRGSSCSSYIFYLLEVHDVNSIKYDIPFKEFSKEE